MAAHDDALAILNGDGVVWPVPKAPSTTSCRDDKAPVALIRVPPPLAARGGGHTADTAASTTHSPYVPESTQLTSIFAKLMAVIRNNAPPHSYSFTLSPIPGPAAAAASPTPSAVTRFERRSERVEGYGNHQAL
ncbi:hypothetical protein K466DRAFT_605304 [Polyporus arcularius HHB13444]|uniref:Uncharacterized protein n=1 Tax=Polyporus arcularius HHB13444 TaxID=1314778 RepID=A0A5C3NT24_9APHY|nr:hypothetical protein K466DRAFT_605304 [Polyporus arcularius HHB13444]